MLTHQDHAEYVVLGLFDRDGRPEEVALSDEEGHLELEVHEVRRAEHGRLVRLGPLLAVGTPDRGPGHVDGARPPVVADRQVLPEWVGEKPGKKRESYRTETRLKE